MTTRDWVRLLWRRRRLLVLTVLLCLAGAVIYSLLAARVWEGRAELVVSSEAPMRTSILAAVPVLGLLGEPSSLLGSADLATQVQLIASRPCLEQARSLMGSEPALVRRMRERGLSDETLETLPELLDRLPASPPPATWEGEWETLLDTLLVSGVEDSDVVEVRAWARDREMACDFINALLLAYLGRSLADARAAARRTLRYIEEELVSADGRLAEAEESLRAFAERAGTIELQAAAEQQIGLLLRLDEQAALAEATMRAQSALQTELEQRLLAEPERVTASTVIARNPHLNDLQRSLAAAEADRAALLEDYQPGATPVRAAQARVDELRAELAAAAQEVVQARDEQLNPVAQELLKESLIAGGEGLAARSSMRVLEGAVAEVEARLAELPDEQITLLKLQREAQLAEKIYLALKEKQQEYEITEKTKMPAASLVEQAIPADRPIRPKPALNIAAGLAAGVLIGLLLVGAVEHFDESLRTPQRLARAAGAPVVAVLGGPAWRDLAAGGGAAEEVRTALGQVLSALREGLTTTGAHPLVLLADVTGDGPAEAVGRALVGMAADAGMRARMVRADGPEMGALVAPSGDCTHWGPAHLAQRMPALGLDLAVIVPGAGGDVSGVRLLTGFMPTYLAADLRRARCDEVERRAAMLEHMGARVRAAIATGASECAAEYYPTPRPQEQAG